VGKYGRAGQATDENIIRRMCIACRVNRATNMHSEYVILIDSQRQQTEVKRTHPTLTF
jgi:hypothetical protein